MDTVLDLSSRRRDLDRQRLAALDYETILTHIAQRKHFASEQFKAEEKKNKRPIVKTRNWRNRG